MVDIRRVITAILAHIVTVVVPPFLLSIMLVLSVGAIGGEFLLLPGAFTLALAPRGITIVLKVISGGKPFSTTDTMVGHRLPLQLKSYAERLFWGYALASGYSIFKYRVSV
jgi:hypothetical protein